MKVDSDSPFDPENIKTPIYFMIICLYRLKEAKVLKGCLFIFSLLNFILLYFMSCEN